MRVILSGHRRGLGAALSEHLSGLGHQVFGFSSASDGAERVDAADFAQVSAWMAATVERHGPPDLVVANAALVVPPRPLWQLEPTEFSRLIDVNVKGMFYLFRAAIPAMLGPARGVLVGISSGYGRSTTPRMSAYCTSKWAVEGMVKTLAQELPKTMAAVSVDPGTLQTDMLKQALGAGAKFFPTPDQWVGKAANLLLGLGPQHNGQSLCV
ncbi:SDR family oxidoreductase [bacterium]|nr:SDR family oxidoreductase [bacterium]